MRGERNGASGRRPLIGLTVGPTRARDGLEYAQLRMSYVRAVEQAGGLPVLIPPLDGPALVALHERLDGGLVGQGGLAGGVQSA